MHLRSLRPALLLLLITGQPALAADSRPPGMVQNLIEGLPAPLLRAGPQGLLWWQWLALPLLALLAWVVGRILSKLTRAVLIRLAQRSRATWDDQLVEHLSRPITAAWALGVFALGSHFLWLTAAGRLFVDRCLSIAIFIVFFWALLRALDTLKEAVAGSLWAAARPGSRALLPLINRVAKVLVLAVAVVAVLSELGYPVASLIAGLGIGGLAVALAAQKTVENLFGAFSIGVDQPFREGDFVKVEDFVGTVESIGLRSTRFRTLDRTMITLPNGKLAEMRVENYAARDRFRMAAAIGLVYSTTPAQMRTVLQQLEAAIRAHPKNWPDAVTVRFSGLGASSLDIDVMAWFQTADWAEFQGVRQELLLQFMEIVERAGSSFAFPTRTLHVINESVDEPRRAS